MGKVLLTDKFEPSCGLVKVPLNLYFRNLVSLDQNTLLRMSFDSAIFIFTRDRPDTLVCTAEQMSKTGLTVFIVDDSEDPAARMANEAIAYRLGITYLGIIAYHVLCKQIADMDLSHTFLLRPLGQPSWNLGYARNFALLFARQHDFETVLFTDDDIQIKDTRLVEQLFEKTKGNTFAGAAICGMVDDSILGYLAAELDIRHKRLLSGGFLAFRPAMIEHYFINCYNEDWIWIALHLKSGKTVFSGEVFQQITDPYANYKDKIIFQEFGERALIGTMIAEGDLNLLCEQAFWQHTVIDRLNYLQHLHELCATKTHEQYCEMVDLVLKTAVDQQPVSFMHLFQSYREYLPAFKKILKALEN